MTIPPDGSGARAPHPDDSERRLGAAARWRAAATSERLAAAVFVVAAVVAVPLLLWANRSQWFYLDEWDFLAHRSLAPSDLLRAHNEHWVTLPLIAYRLTYGVVGLHHYWPYQAMAVLTHVAIAVLLWTVMRRVAVHPWVATSLATFFLYFGPGQENLAWGFQITFTGAVAFGLVAVLLADHDGPWGRRDDAAMAAALAALACSGVGLAMLAGVACSVWCRRGLRVALFLVIPPALVYGAWQLAYGVDSAAGERSWTRFADFLRANLQAVANGFGGPLLAAGVVVLAGLGLGLVLRGGPEVGRRAQLAAPLGLAAAGSVFLLSTAYARSGTTGSSASRYVHVVVALVLPLVAVGFTAVVDRWRPALPIALAVVLVAGAGNVGRLSADRVGAGNRPWVLTLAAVDPVPPGLPPDYAPPPSEVYLSVRWLQEERRAGRVPDPPDTSLLGRARVGVSLLPHYEPAGQGCDDVGVDDALSLETGQLLRIHAPRAAIRLNEQAWDDAAFQRFVDEPLAARTFQPGPDGPEVRLEALTDIEVKVFPSDHGPRMELCERP